MSGTFPPKVVAAGEGKTVMLFGVRFGYKVVSGDSGGRLAVLEAEIPPGTLVKPHSHAREDEFSLVLSGTVEVRTRSTTSSPRTTGSPSPTTGSRSWNGPTASSFDRVPGQPLLQEREGLGGECADIGREPVEACA